MAKVIKILNVYFESDGITCECVCPLQDVTEGDLVQVFLNNAPAIGLVKEVKDIPINEMTDAMYEMKSVIKKLPNPNKQSTKAPSNTIRVGDIVNRNKLLTVIGFGVVGKLVFDSKEVAAHNLEAGDVMYFIDVDGTRFRTAVIAIEDIDDTAIARIHIDAVCKVPALAEFISSNQIKANLDSGEKSIVLKVFNINEEEFEIGDWISAIGSRSFERCRKLKKLVLKTDGVDIEPLAFAYNESIEEIVVADRGASIKLNAFDGCRNLQKVVLPYELYYMRNDFEEYYRNRIIFEYELFGNVLLDGIVYTKSLKTLVCCLNDEIEEYIAPVHVTYMREFAFANCKKLRHFAGSPFMKETSVGEFAGCMNLEKVEYRFENNYDVIFLFGEKYCPDGVPKTVKYKDGSKKVFYLPKNCKYVNLPMPEDILEGTKPQDLSPFACAFIADYYSEVHKTKEAIQFHSIAAFQGSSKSYQKLAEYAQNEYIGQEFFTLDLFDFADRTQDIKAFFYMFSRDYPEYDMADFSNKQIIEKFSEKNELKKLLMTISEAAIFDTDLLNIVLMKLYRANEDQLDIELKRLFLRCANRIGQFDNVLYWMDDLLDEIFISEADYREFAFNIIPVTEFIGKPEKGAFIEHMPESETKHCISRAYSASQNPGADSVELFEEFIGLAIATGDIFYQKCALLTIYAYVSLCWREKAYVTEFKKILERIMELYNEGLDLMCFILLSFKQNLKRSISKTFYMEAAEKLFDHGILYDNIFNNLLGCNAQNKAAFFSKYPEYFSLEDNDSLIMKELNKMWYYIYATTIKKPENSKTEPVIYENYLPELIEGELIAFLNPHEAVTYMKAREIKLAGDFYRVSLGHLLSVMYTNGIDEVRVLPRTLNQIVTKEYIEHIYDRSE